MITIYGAEWCKWCKAAKKLAADRSLEHEWLDIENPGVYDAMKARIPAGAKTIPQIFWDGRYIGGHDAFAAEIENTSGGFGDGKI